MTEEAKENIGDGDEEKTVDENNTDEPVEDDADSGYLDDDDNEA
jgi:hypothetical protein